LPEITEKTLATIPGIGEKRIARYGKQLVERYRAVAPPPPVTGDIQEGGMA
jgi:hypothetical protein